MIGGKHLSHAVLLSEAKMIDHKDAAKVLTYEVKKYKGKLQLVRMWHDGWFPAEPVAGVDFRSKK